MYLTWNSNDLNEALYAAEYMMNPDSTGYFSMIDRAATFDIMGKFWADISSAMENHEDYNTGIIKLCRFANTGGLLNRYFQWQATVVGNTQTLTVQFGYGDGSAFDSGKSHVYNYSQYLSMPDSDREIAILYCKVRNDFTEAASPGYSGWIYYHLICGDVDKCIGRWEAPSTQYPYGRMSYSVSSEGLISDIPGGTVMCYSDNSSSKQMQSELVGLPISANHVQLNSSDSAFHACAEDGSYSESSELPDPNDEDPGGNSKPGGGDGKHKRDNNPIPLPDLPDLSISDTGMITLYKMSAPDMLDFTSYLFLDITQPGGAWAQMKNLLADPLDFIIGLRAIPVDPGSTRASKPKFGTFVWPSAYSEVDQYMSFSCGSVYIEKYYGSCFDYDPYTKVQIFLPGVGFKELPVDDIMGATIEVTYHIDVFTGDCVAFVHTPVVGELKPQIPQIIAQFGGNIGVSIPLARVSYDSAVQNGISMISKALGFVTNAFTQAGGDSGSKINGGALVEQTTMSAVQSMKRGVERSGTAGDSVGYMSSQKPYIIRTIPQQSLPENYKELEGYPSNLAGPLARYRNSGYTTVEAIELQGVTGTDREKAEILSILKGGVLI